MEGGVGLLAESGDDKLLMPFWKLPFIFKELPKHQLVLVDVGGNESLVGLAQVPNARGTHTLPSMLPFPLLGKVTRLF